MNQSFHLKWWHHILEREPNLCTVCFVLSGATLRMLSCLFLWICCCILFFPHPKHRDGLDWSTAVYVRESTCRDVLLALGEWCGWGRVCTIEYILTVVNMSVLGLWIITKTNARGKSCHALSSPNCRIWKRLYHVMMISQHVHGPYVQYACTVTVTSCLHLLLPHPVLISEKEVK